MPHDPNASSRVNPGVNSDKEDDGKEELATIGFGGFGMRDCGSCVLWFSVNMLVGGALIIMSAKEAVELIERHHIRDVKDLDGRPCVVKSRGLGFGIKFVDLLPVREVSGPRLWHQIRPVRS